MGWIVNIQRAREKAENLPKLAECTASLAPEYFPSEEEFADPFAYIESIEIEASRSKRFTIYKYKQQRSLGLKGTLSHRYGICKIVPPASWKPDFVPRFTAVPADPTIFYTKRQLVTRKTLIPVLSWH